MTSCSSGTFPARSPQPFIVTQMCVAPDDRAVSAFISPSPKSLWRCAERGVGMSFLICVKR